MTDAVLLAHGGGLPEIAAGAVPVLLFVAIVYAGKRAERRDKDADDERGEDD